MANTELEQYMKALSERAAFAKERYAEGSPEYFRSILHNLSDNLYLPALYEKLLAQAVKENDFAGLKSIFYHKAKISLLPSSSSYDHCGCLWHLLDLLACADTDYIYRILPEGLPLSTNGYPMYIHGTNVLLCLLYNTKGKIVYEQDKVTEKAEKFTASKKPIWERALVSCLLAIMGHDVSRFSENLQNLCVGYNRVNIAPYMKMQCQNAYGILALARRFWTAEEFAAVTLPEYKNFSKGYAEWLFAQKELSDELCVTYEAPFVWLDTILKKPAAVTRIYQKYLDSDNPHLSNAEKKAWYLDHNRMMEELLGAAPGTLADENADVPEKSGLSKEELTKLQRYIGHSTDELPAEQIIAHLETVNLKMPFTKENWEKLLIPACGNQNIEVLAYVLDRAGDLEDVGQYMKHAVMGQEKRKDYLAKRIEILKKLIPYIPEKEKTSVLSETLVSAAWYGETEVVRFLIESGADVHYRDEQGKDALEYAREFSEKFGNDTLYQYLRSLNTEQKPQGNKKKEKGKQQKNALHGIKREIKRRIRRRREARVEVYYHPRQGYLIIASAVQKDSAAWLSIPPLETVATEAATKELGAKIREGLRKSKEAGFVDRKDVEDFKFWQMTEIKGINGFKSFSKRFQCINFFRKGKTLTIEAMVRDSYGAYEAPKDEESRILLPASASDEKIGQAVLKLLKPEKAPVGK